MPYYDKADWHSGAANFPKGLPAENGGTHIGMFLAWVILNGLDGELHRQESAPGLQAVRAREITGRDFLFEYCDGKFWEECLNDEGNAFAKTYYLEPYMADYEKALGADVSDLYEATDTWSNYDRVAPLISRRFMKWKSGSGKRFWEFWKS